MNCLKCNVKSCRSAQSCGLESFDRNQLKDRYLQTQNQSVVQAAAELVDNGRAGELSRMEELLEFMKTMDYKKPGLAYCYGMEKQAESLMKWYAEKGVKLTGISCTAGAHSQNELNIESSISGVSCNPLSQAEQMNQQDCDLAILFGLCMGHDILFTRYFQGDVSTLVVKDRKYDHVPLKALEGFTS